MFCLCFNSEALLGIQAMFSLMMIFVFPAFKTRACAGSYTDAVCSPTHKNKMKLVDFSFFLWLEGASGRKSKDLSLLLSHQSMLQTLQKLFAPGLSRVMSLCPAKPNPISLANEHHFGGTSLSPLNLVPYPCCSGGDKSRNPVATCTFPKLYSS